MTTTDATADRVIAAVEGLRADRNRLLAVNGRLVGLVCDLADRFDTVDSDGNLTVPLELIAAAVAVRDAAWQAAVDRAVPQDFLRGEK